MENDRTREIAQNFCNYAYIVHTETIYNNIFGYLPFLPLTTRRKAARWITDKINLTSPVYIPKSEGVCVSPGDNEPMTFEQWQETYNQSERA